MTKEDELIFRQIFFMEVKSRWEYTSKRERSKGKYKEMKFNLGNKMLRRIFTILLWLSSVFTFNGFSAVSLQEISSKKFREKLSCRSQDGLELQAFIPVTDQGEFFVILNLNGKAGHLSRNQQILAGEKKKDENVEISIFRDLKNKIYAIDGKNRSDVGVVQNWFKLYAIPATLKFITKETGYESSFRGNLFFLFDEINGAEAMKTVECSLKTEN